MRLTPQFLDEIRTRLPVSQVVARKVALKRAGREFKGLSPFKRGKPPSFTVNDQKGFYHCFASGEHGDIFTFVMKTKGLSFPGGRGAAGREAGVPAQAATSGEAERADSARGLRPRRSRRRLVRGQAQGARGPGGSALPGAARPAAPDHRRLPPRLRAAGRSALKEHLASLGFTPQEMAASGMQIAGEDIPRAL